MGDPPAPRPLHGRLVRLHAREHDSVPSVCRWVNDPEVTRHIAVRYPSSRAAQEAYYAANHEAGYAVARFEIETLDGTLIGNCVLRSGPPEDRRAEAGITIGERGYWSRGYGTDAMRVLCRFGFLMMNLHRIELDVFADNRRAQRSYEKLGFRAEGRRRDADFRYGSYRDVIHMGLLRDERIEEDA